MTEVPPPSASPGSALTELQTDLALALRAPNVAMDRELLAAYVEAAAPNSIRALRQDVETFNLWCRRSDTRAFPATPGMVADWLKHRASEGAAPASLVRYKASIAKAHRLLGLDDPTKHEICRLAIAATASRASLAVSDEGSRSSTSTKCWYAAVAWPSA